MALPNNFSPAEHLQDLMRNSVNKLVREWFSDVGPDDWDPDITTARGSLRIGCTHQENDTMDITVLRTLLFYFVCKKGQDFSTPVFGIPIETYNQTRKFRPQITLYFIEDPQDVEELYAPITGEISFRLMGETESSITMSELKIVANKIKSEFATGNGEVWKKGKVMCSYIEKEKGYQLQLLCRDKTEGKRIVSKVLDCQNHTPDWKYLTVNENDEPTQAYPTLPELKPILGKTRRMPRKRPIGDVRFQFASCSIWGLPNPIILVDRSGRYLKPLAD